MRHEPVGGPVTAALLVWSVAALSPATTCLAEPPTTVEASADDSRLAPRLASLAELPLTFEENRGQAEERVDFLSRGGGYTLLLSPTEATFALRPGPGLARAAKADVTLRFEDANPTARASGVDPLPGHVNYFIGNDPARWRTGVPTYARVLYEDVYPGIDLVYYGNPRQLEYDLVVSPGASPELIRLTIEGAERIDWTDDGDLVVHTDAGDLIHEAPRVYQESDGTRRSVEARYERLDSDSIGIRLGDYDAGQPLVIDPTIVYSTFLGGTVGGNEVGNSIAVDAAEDIYVHGGASNSTGFPGSAGPSGASEIFVSKINAAGSAVLFTTFLGGSGTETSLTADLAVDQAGSVYIAGGTNSTDFPTLNAFQTSLAGFFDAVVVKLDSSGSIVYSTYLGGPDHNDGTVDIAVDSSGHAFVTGSTRSFGFSTTPNAFQVAKPAFRAAFVTKLSPDGSGLVYSTYLGGNHDTLGSGIAIDDSGHAYVAGKTTFNFPTTPGAFRTANAGGYDAFITKFDPTGESLVFSTYLDGSSGDSGHVTVRIAVDATDHVYVSGETLSTDFPTTPGALQGSNAGGRDCFVTKLTPSGSALVYSTYLGGSVRDVPFNLAVDAAGNVHLAGLAESADFPTANPVQAVFGGQADAFVATISSDGTSLLFSTFWGGGGFQRMRSASRSTVRGTCTPRAGLMVRTRSRRPREPFSPPHPPGRRTRSSSSSATSCSSAPPPMRERTSR